MDDVAGAVGQFGEDGVVAFALFRVPKSTSMAGLQYERERTVRVHGQRPVHQVQVDIVQTQVLQTGLETLLHTRVV